MPLLYEVVIARHQDGLLSLHRALLDDHSSQLQSQKTLRGRVRRLCVRIKAEEVQEGGCYDFERLADILRNLPNLEDFTFHDSSEFNECEKLPEERAFPQVVLTALTTRGATLRTVDWRPPVNFCPDLFQLKEAFSHMPNLRNVRVLPAPGAGIAGNAISDTCPLQLSRLQFLDSGGNLSIPLNWQIDSLPSLQKLYLLEQMHWFFYPPVSVSFRTQITQLTVFIHSNYCDYFVELALRTFPNVVDLVLCSLSSEWLPLLCAAPWKPTNVERLGIGRCSSKSLHSDYGPVLKIIRLIHAPKLSVVRLVGQDDWAALRSERPIVWAQFQDVARAKGLRFEDSIGEVL